MRISMSDGYDHNTICKYLTDCQSHYCNTHRLLWSDCETVKSGFEGDRDVVNGLHAVYECGDCPDCEADYQRRQVKEWEANQTKMKSTKEA